MKLQGNCPKSWPTTKILKNKLKRPSLNLTPTTCVDSHKRPPYWRTKRRQKHFHYRQLNSDRHRHHHKTHPTDPDNNHNTILSQLRKSEQIEDIVKVINLKCNNNCYVKTSHETGNPLSTELNTIVIADSGNQPTQNWIKKRLSNLYPQIKSLLEAGKPAEGKSICIDTTVMTDEADDTNKRKSIYILGAKNPETGNEPRNS